MHLLSSRRFPVACRTAALATLAALAALATSCGGGGDSSAAAPPTGTPSGPTDAPVADAGAAGCAEPAEAAQFDPSRGFVFDAAFQQAALVERLAYLRCLAGAPPVRRDARIDAAADRHAAYSLANQSTAHAEDPGAPMFTGATPGDRLRVAGYGPSTWGEVLSRTGPLADEAYEGLVAAVYHRLVMLAPQFTDVGVGLRHDGAGTMIAVADYGAQSRVASAGRLIGYPADGQRNVPASFDSDRETPDPAPDAGVVGYPVSLQTDRGATLQVETFELVRAIDGAAVPATVHGTGAQADAEIDRSEAFLLPRAALDADTEYEARFAGSIDGAPASRRWRFRTLAQQPLAVQPRPDLALGEYARVRLAGCGTRYSWSYTPGLEVSLYTAGWMQVRGVQPGAGTVVLRDGCGRTQRLDFTVR